jgi:hypothetical protein
VRLIRPDGEPVVEYLGSHNRLGELADHPWRSNEWVYDLGAIVGPGVPSGDTITIERALSLVVPFGPPRAQSDTASITSRPRIAHLTEFELDRRG